MEIANIRIKIIDVIKKYKYAVIVLLVGVSLMLVPVGKKEKTVAQADTQKISEDTDISKALEQILNQIDGAGEVRVLLTVSTGEETVYQTDNRISQSEESNNTQTDTVMITDAQRNETGLIKQTISPVYRGAVVVCQGADSAQVRLSIVDAVTKLTGLSSDRISVLKMK